MGQLALKDAGNPYFSAAIMSSVNAKNLDAVLLEVVTGGKDTPLPPAVIENLLRLAHAFGDKKAMAVLLNAIGQPKEGKVASWQFSALAGLLDALEQRGTSLAKIQKDEAAALQASQEQLAGLFAAARASVADAKAPRAERLQAVRLLGRGLDRQAGGYASSADRSPDAPGGRRFSNGGGGHAGAANRSEGSRIAAAKLAKLWSCNACARQVAGRGFLAGANGKKPCSPRSNASRFLPLRSGRRRALRLARSEGTQATPGPGCAGLSGRG